jgi:hemolysin activation/secretion protein
LVQRLVVEGSTVFSEAELAAAVAPFEWRLLTLEELQQAADAVTQIYLNAGYLTSEAVVPPHRPLTHAAEAAVPSAVSPP